MELLESGQQRVTEMIKGLEPVMYEEMLKGLSISVWKKGSEGNSPMCTPIHQWLEGVNKEDRDKFWTSCLKDKRQ